MMWDRVLGEACGGRMPGLDFAMVSARIRIVGASGLK
jgi:hypothetical protein